MRKKWFAALIIFACICVLSFYALIVAICVTVSMAQVYPRPLDSFWSFELSITLLVIAVVVLVGSILGCVFCARRLRNK